MAVYMYFIGQGSDHTNRHFGFGEKWERAILHKHNTICLTPQSGLLDNREVREIARQLQEVETADERTKMLQEVFQEASELGLWMVIDW